MLFQDLIWTLAMTGMGLVALGFPYVIGQAGKPADGAATRRAAHTSNVMRRCLFGALLMIFVGGTYATLHQFPIPPQQGLVAGAMAAITMYPDDERLKGAGRGAFNLYLIMSLALFVLMLLLGLTLRMGQATWLPVRSMGLWSPNAAALFMLGDLLTGVGILAGAVVLVMSLVNVFYPEMVINALMVKNLIY